MAGMRFSLSILAVAVSLLLAAGCRDEQPSDNRADVDPADIDRTGSCSERCGTQSDSGCWCDEQCVDYGDCCDDVGAACDPEPPQTSCADRCGDDDASGCGCDEQCGASGTCCSDYQAECQMPPDPDSCVGSCGMRAPGGCWCDTDCADFGNCCADYEEACGDPPDPDSCVGACGGPAPGGCACDAQCEVDGTCCADYAAACVPTTDPWTGLSDGALIAALATTTTGPHNGLDYTEARNHMYGVDGGSGIDIDPVSGRIEGVYTGVTAAPDGTRTPGGILNTEHSWPQSEGASSFPQRGDIHHLFPSLQTANSQRSSFEYGETVCSGGLCPWDQGGSELGDDAGGMTVFEVRGQTRGDVARAHFYFAVRYERAIGGDEEAVLKAWHAQDPPDGRERDRNAAIEAVQGNRNPFVDYPGIVERISNF